MVNNIYNATAAYAAALALAGRGFDHEKILSGQGVFKAENGGTLSVEVDGEGLVCHAAHQGFTGDLRPMMEIFCVLLEGRPLREGSDHGVIRLEARLRDPLHPPSIPGLITPENSDPIFGIPTSLVRAVYRDFAASRNVPPTRNYWRDPLPSSWLSLSNEAKLQRAQEKLTAGCRTLGLQTDVIVTEIMSDTRLVLAFRQQTGAPDFSRNMIKLERWLRAEMGFAIELQLENIEDRNKRLERTKRA